MGILSRLEFYWQYLTSDPLNFVLYIAYYTVSILMTLILHEIAHGYVALQCGDPTAKMLGRLSLDPRKHLDPIGTVFMVLFGFGWARPVPVNSRNFGDARRDDILVSIAGVTVNFTLFLLSTALAVGLNGRLWRPEVIQYNGGAKQFLSSNSTAFSLLIYNGAADLTQLMSHPWLRFVQRFLLLFGQMNLAVAVFNLLPIPPLDGYHLLNDTLLRGRLQLNAQWFRILQIVVMVLCLSGALTGILTTVIDAVESAVLNLMLLAAGLK